MGDLSSGPVVKIEMTPVQEETLKNCAVILVKIDDNVNVMSVREYMDRVFPDTKYALYGEKIEFTFVKGQDDKTVNEIMNEALDKLKEE